MAFLDRKRLELVSMILRVIFYHSFPRTTHVRCVRRIKLPRTALITQIQSDLSCLAGPLIAKKRRSALIQLDVFMDSITSICAALGLMHIKRLAQRLLLVAPSLVR